MYRCSRNCRPLLSSENRPINKVSKNLTQVSHTRLPADNSETNLLECMIGLAIALGSTVRARPRYGVLPDEHSCPSPPKSCNSPVYTRSSTYHSPPPQNENLSTLGYPHSMRGEAAEKVQSRCGVENVGESVSKLRCLPCWNNGFQAEIDRENVRYDAALNLWSWRDQLEGKQDL